MAKKILIFIIIMIMIVPNLVGCKTRVKSYTLQDAYEKGLITKEALLSMAYYWNNGTTHNESIMGDNFTPIPKEPEELSEETIEIIKKYIAEEITKEEIKMIKKYKPTISDDEIEPYSTEHVRIWAYFGTYNNLICIQCTDFYPPSIWTADVSPRHSTIVDDVMFYSLVGDDFITCYEIK